MPWNHRRSASTAALAALVLIAAPALAGVTPAPAKPVGPAFFTGRWYEIARTLNPNQKDCEAPTYEFGARKDGSPTFTLTCRKGAPNGPIDRLSVRIKLPKGADASRFQVTALAGVVRVDYTVVDHDDGYNWAMMATNGGEYIWLLARSSAMDQATRTRLVARIRTLGYDPAKLIYPRF